MKHGHTLVWALVLARFLTASAVSSAQETPLSSSDFLSLDQVVSEVLSNNPALKSARANWEALRQRIPQVRAWDDVRAGLDAERSATTRFDSFNAIEWMVAQTLPLSGKNRRRARAALAEAAAAFADWQRRESDVTARARSAYYGYANAHAQLKLNAKNEELLRRFLAISQERKQMGPRRQVDLLAIETELARLLEARFDLDLRLSDAQSAINVLRNRLAQTELPHPENLIFKPLVLFLYPIQSSAHESGEAEFNFSQSLSVHRMQSLALAHRPELLGAEQRIEAAQARYKLARREWIPDPELRIEARQFQGAAKGLSEFDTGLFFNLPWLNRSKYQAAILEARKNLESARHDLDAVRTETLGLVRDQLKKTETLQNHYELLRDRIVPLAEQTLQATQIAYTDDQANVFELLKAQRT
ncbi:MAG: TolC family protein, partial [Verrucomicrobiota bacterium]